MEQHIKDRNFFEKLFFKVKNNNRDNVVVNNKISKL